ncbi:MAG TPA: GH92 family glycosyl hydrolase [Taishania sp.]|nr:GH92 family glycosyl hydrolase [Taishania sp.]
MKYFTCIFFIVLFIPVFSQKSQTLKVQDLSQKTKREHKKEESYIKYVNPFIGTGGHGHTYPGASAPFGMMQLSPDTRYNGWDGCSGYHYSDSLIYGFSHTHLSGTGVEDYCDILIVPQYGKPRTTSHFFDNVKGYGSTFKHQNEIAEPGYYAVTLDNGIFAEFTVSERGGIHHYKFPSNSDSKFILIDLTHRDQLIKTDLKIISDNEFSGFRQSSSWAKDQQIYFYLATSVKPLNSQIIPKEDKLLIEFPANTTDLELRIGISSVSDQGAKLNLEKEIGNTSFEQVKQETQKKWNHILSDVEIDLTDKDLATSFYTALYHAYLAPNVFSDVDGQYLGHDKNIHKTNSSINQYTVFSLWDTYRATHPWYTIFQPKLATEFIKSFENIYLYGGKLPVWELAGNETDCMIGYHAASVIADAYTKGLKQFDVPLLIHALEKTANENEFGKGVFNSQGFIDFKKEPESVSKTLEYAYDSYCIYQFLKQAKEDGYAVKDKALQTYHKRAFFFINVFDPQTKFMRARTGGLWMSPFKPQEVNFHYTEANSWQYSLYAPHAIHTLIDLLGGKDALENWLDELFLTKTKLSGNKQVDITGLIGQYAHGNEPSHHMAYLYNYTNSPHKTAIYVDSIMRTFYKNQPDGLAGNEDCGQMSSWLNFSALGFYPIAPGNQLYEFGRPMFNYAKLNIGTGKSISIFARNNSRQNKFIQSIKINGQEYKKRYISHQDLLRAQTIEFEMGSKPSGNYNVYEVAPSFDSIPSNFVAVPYFSNDSLSFIKTTSIEVKSLNNHSKIFYALNKVNPTYSDGKKYKKPIKINKTTTISTWCYDAKKGTYSPIVTNTFSLMPTDLKLVLKTPYRPQYSASGPNALIDGSFGTGEFRCGDWQGFYNTDTEAEIQFNIPKSLKKIGLSALQSTRSWIFPPSKVDFEITYKDGTISRKTVELDVHPTADNTPEKPIKYEVPVDSKPIVSIAFKAYNYGVNPDWHLSPGYPTFIFLDEFYFE